MESSSAATETAKEECAICFGDLCVKHTVTLQPCQHKLCHHKFHSSCARKWMEQQEKRQGQTCPICRALTEAVIDEEGKSTPPGFPYGETGQPTRAVLSSETQPGTIQLLLQETQSRLDRYEELEKDETKGDEYKADVQEEMKHMKTRLATLQKMKSDIDREERQMERDIDREVWEERVQLLLSREQQLTHQLRDTRMVFEHYAVDSMGPYDVNTDAREYVEWRQMIERAVSIARALEHQLVEVRNRLREMREEDARGDTQPAQPDEEREGADADEDDPPNLQGLSIGGDVQEQQ